MLCYSDVFHSTIIVYGARDAVEMLLNITEWMLPACTAHASKSGGIGSSLNLCAPPCELGREWRQKPSSGNNSWCPALLI
jgi:hypothetical protein